MTRFVVIPNDAEIYETQHGIHVVTSDGNTTTFEMGSMIISENAFKDSWL